MSILTAILAATALCGHVGERWAQVIDARIVGPRARGDVFEETVNAFRTRYDDLHPVPDGQRKSGYWQGEYWGKTMLSHCAYARLSGDADEKAFIHRRALELVKGFQRTDGYLATYDDPDFIRGWCWNVWSRKYTMWALVEAYDLTGDGTLLAAAEKMVGHLAAQLKRLGVGLDETGAFAGLPSMSILKPLLLVHERSGNRTALELARAIVAANDRADGRCPNLIANAFTDRAVHMWYPHPEDWAKAYELMSVAEGFIEYAKVTGERRPLEAAIRLWDLLARDELNALDGVGLHDHFIQAAAYPNAITELCDVIHWMRLCRGLYEATGDGKYLDHWERAFLNAFLAGVYRDGSWGAHDVRSHGHRHLTAPYEVKMLHHSCCIDNTPRAFGDYAECQVERRGEGLKVNFYTDGRYSGRGVDLEISGDYPIGTSVTVRVRSATRMPVAFREPDWCRGRMKVEGPRAVGGADEYRLDFEMTPRLVCGELRPRLGADLTGLQSDWFEMAKFGHNPEMEGLSRVKPGVMIRRGPLLLAKATRAGADERTVLEDLVSDTGWTATLERAGGADVWGAWRLDLRKGDERKSVGLCDFPSAADTGDMRQSFSIWL